MAKITDLPSRLLSAVVNGMPAHRREWGEAMLAELAHLDKPTDRWCFAVSCLRPALFPPGRFESFPIMKVIVAMLGVGAVLGFIVLRPELSGAGLAWAYLIYGMVFLAIPTALFGNFAVLAMVTWGVTCRALGREPWPGVPRLRHWGRLAVEIVFGLLNPLLYLAILTAAFQLRPKGAEWWVNPLVTVAWILLFAFWIARACGAAFNPSSRVARVAVRTLLLASMACLLAFASKDAWLFMESTWSEGSENRWLNFLRLCPLYLIPALLLGDYLHASLSATSQNKEGEKPASGGFFLLSSRAARWAVVGVAGFAMITLASAAYRRSESNVRRLIGNHRPAIHAAAERYNVDPRLIASIVFVTHREQLSPFRDALERLMVHAWGMNFIPRGPGNERWEEIGTDENPILNVALDISVGMAQIKPRTAQTASVLATGRTPDTLTGPIFYRYRNVEPVGDGWPPEITGQIDMDSPIPVPAERAAVGRMLLNAESNLQTCALILALYQRQWEAANRDWSIRERPDILATLYQIGFARSKPHASPRSNDFGDRVRHVYEKPWLRELFANTP